MTRTSTPEKGGVIAWAVRSADASFDAWDALADWMEGDPARGAAYRSAVATVIEAVALIATYSPTVDSVPE